MGAAGVSRRWKIQRTSSGAATNMMTVACTMEIRSAETCVSSCIKPAPLRMEPKRNAAGRIAQGLPRASSATAMESKP
jgi:hypothetical protein